VEESGQPTTLAKIIGRAADIAQEAMRQRRLCRKKCSCPCGSALRQLKSDLPLNCLRSLRCLLCKCLKCPRQIVDRITAVVLPHDLHDYFWFFGSSLFESEDHVAVGAGNNNRKPCSVGDDLCRFCPSTAP
jgi:hypothetical protein